MFWSRQLNTAELIELCRALRYALSGGMMLRDAMALLAREGSPRLRRAAADLGEDLKAGWSMHEAMDRHTRVFPPLFRALTTVGEETGNLPEVMHELERYYITQQKLRRDFMSDISWPIIQFVAAILIVAGLIVVLGMIQPSGPGTNPVDPLGLGLLGTDGATRFLAVVFGSLALVWVVLRVISRLTRNAPRIQRLVFYIPVLGPCLRALALNRLCIALRLMLDTRMSVLKAIRLAFAATDNSAFIAVAPEVEGSIRRGNSIADAFEGAAIFPRPFRSAVAVAEESGRLPEMCAVQAENYDEQARRHLSTLNKVASIVIWLVVSVFIIIAIFRIFNNVYLKNLENRIDPETGAPTLKDVAPAPPRDGR